MRRVLLCVGLLAGFAGTAVGAPAAIPKGASQAASAAVQPVFCFGFRRDYRNFNHCWHINAPRFRGAARYCSRICE